MNLKGSNTPLPLPPHVSPSLLAPEHSVGKKYENSTKSENKKDEREA